MRSLDAKSVLVGALLMFLVQRFVLPRIIGNGQPAKG